MPSLAITLGQETAECVRDFSENAGRSVTDVLRQGLSKSTGHLECDIDGIENQLDGGLTFGMLIEGPAATVLAAQARAHNMNEAAYVSQCLNGHNFNM